MLAVVTIAVAIYLFIHFLIIAVSQSLSLRTLKIRAQVKRNNSVAKYPYIMLYDISAIELRNGASQK